MDYLAPEIVNQSLQNEKVDIWCLGILLYELVSGCVPFSAKNLQDKILVLKNLRLVFNGKMELSQDLKNLIALMLKRNPEERPNIFDIFAHKWMVFYAKKLDIDINRYLDLSKNTQVNLSTNIKKSSKDEECIFIISSEINLNLI